MTRTLQLSLFAAALSYMLSQRFIFAIVSEKAQTKFQIYYDGLWKPVPLLAATNVSSAVKRTPQRRYGLLPCECAELICGCCVNTNFFSTQRSGCMNMTYDPQEFAIGMNMLWNGESVYQNSVSAKNPPPACMEAPIPYLPSIQFCIRLFDIYTPGRNIHMCINFETRVARAPVMILEFDCIQMGADGIDHVKFNTTQSSSMGETVSDLQDTNVESVDVSSSTASSTTKNQESTDIFKITANRTEDLTSSFVLSTVNSTETPEFTDITRTTTNEIENPTSSDMPSTASSAKKPASSGTPLSENASDNPGSKDN